MCKRVISEDIMAIWAIGGHFHQFSAGVFLQAMFPNGVLTPASSSQICRDGLAVTPQTFGVEADKTAQDSSRQLSTDVRQTQNILTWSWEKGFTFMRTAPCGALV